MRWLYFVLLLVLMWPLRADERTAPFIQETRTEYTGKDGLPAEVVHDIAINKDGALIAATAKGIALFDDALWTPLPDPPFEILRMAAAKDAIYGAGENSIALYKDRQWGSLPSLEGRAITCLFATPDSAGLLIGTTQGLMTYAQGKLIPIPGPEEAIRAIAHSKKGELVVGTDTALYTRYRGAEDWLRLYPADDSYSWSPRKVHALAFTAEGKLCFGCEQGVGLRDEAGDWTLYTGKEGLPYNGFRRAVPGAGEAVIWFATDHGALRYEAGAFAYRFSKRWLPDDSVNGFAITEAGAAWIATDAGLSLITRDPMTLDDKAAFFTQQCEARHNREGFVTDCRLEKRFDPASWQPKITDNDGGYTGMYGAAQAFRYAVTKDPEAKALAKRSFERLKWLVDITGTGMPARVIIPADWPEPVNEQYGPEYNQRKQQGDPFWKQITPRFVPSADGKHRWKCDTSSDELASHFFFYGVYYDLAAESEEEKAAVRATVTAITDHLIDNGFLLRDHDGQPTRWGNFSPEYVNSMWGWEQRGLNSMMILSILTVAEHITGNAAYAEAAALLRDKHHYHINAMHAKEYFPPDNVVPWDNNLCLKSFYGLMKYEENPELMIMWRQSMEHAWAHIANQTSPFWNFLHQACAEFFIQKVEAGIFDNAFPELGPYKDHVAAHFTQYESRREESLDTLRRLPLDLIGYSIDNRHRLDIVLDPTPGAQSRGGRSEVAYGWGHDGRALPIDERGHVRQDRDNFRLNACEDDGWGEHEGTFFLLPYWLGVYHGFIQ